jgi:hypothetical protein
MESVLIEKEAMKLPLFERASLVDRLLQTLDAEKDSSLKAWTEVTEKRLENFRAGKMEAFDGQTVIESLRNSALVSRYDPRELPF